MLIRLKIAGIPLILPVHGELDRAREAQRELQNWHTGRGIGPAYEDKVGRRAVRFRPCRRTTLSNRIDRLFSTTTLSKGNG